MFNAIHPAQPLAIWPAPMCRREKTSLNSFTAHGPFELTAIVLSAGAGLRLGLYG